MHGPSRKTKNLADPLTLSAQGRCVSVAAQHRRQMSLPAPSWSMDRQTGSLDQPFEGLKRREKVAALMEQSVRKMSKRLRLRKSAEREPRRALSHALNNPTGVVTVARMRFLNALKKTSNLTIDEKIALYNASIYVSNKYDAYAAVQLVGAAFVPGGEILRVENLRKYLRAYNCYKRSQMCVREHRCAIRQLLGGRKCDYDMDKVNFVRMGRSGSREDLQFTLDCLSEEKRFEIGRLSQRKCDRRSKKQRSKDLMRAGVEMNPGPPKKNRRKLLSNAKQSVIEATKRVPKHDPAELKARAVPDPPPKFERIEFLYEAMIEKLTAEYESASDWYACELYFQQFMVPHQIKYAQMYDYFVEQKEQVFEQFVGQLPEVVIGWATQYKDKDFLDLYGVFCDPSHVLNVDPYADVVNVKHCTPNETAWLKGVGDHFLEFPQFRVPLLTRSVENVCCEHVDDEEPDLTGVRRILESATSFAGKVVRTITTASVIIRPVAPKIVHDIVKGGQVNKILWRLRVRPIRIQGCEDVRNPYNRNSNVVTNEVYANVFLEARICVHGRATSPKIIFDAENVRWSSTCTSFVNCSSLTVRETADLSMARLSRDVGTNVPWNFVTTGAERQVFSALGAHQQSFKSGDLN